MGQSAPRTQTVQETSRNEPWAPAQPYLQAAMNAAYGQFQQGPPDPFPGATMAPMSAQTQAGLQQVQNNAAMAPALANDQLGALGRVMNQGPTPGTLNMARTAMGAGANPFTGVVSNLAQQGVDTSGLAPFRAGVSNPFGGQIAGLGQQRTDTSGLSPFRTGVSNPFGEAAVAAAQGEGGGPGMQALGQFASGQMMANPFLDATYDAAARQVEDRVNSRMALAGRTGSGAHQALMTRGLSDLGTQIYGQAYEQDMGRRLQAAGQRAPLEQSAFSLGANLSEADFARRMAAEQAVMGANMEDRAFARGAFGDAANLSEADVARRMAAEQAVMGQGAADRGFALDAFGAASGLYNQDFVNALSAFRGLGDARTQQNAQTLQASAALPGVYDFATQGARDLMGVGSAMEGYEQALIDDARNRYDYIAQAPWDYIGRLNAIASGQGQLGGTQTGSRQMPYQASNPFLQGVGALGSLASGIGAMAPLFALSDPALKRDARRIATDDRGVTWHEYAYAWDGPGVRRVGVMADELEAIAPQFVVTGPDGFRRVDYGALVAWEG